MKKLKKFFTEERVDEIYETMFNLAMGLGEVASQWVYVNIWHTFIDNDTPEDIDIARRVACIIIGDPNFEIRALEARDYIDYCMATHEYERLAVLANDALDLYLKGVISLHEFKLIIAANKN